MVKMLILIPFLQKPTLLQILKELGLNSNKSFIQFQGLPMIEDILI